MKAHVSIAILALLACSGVQAGDYSSEGNTYSNGGECHARAESGVWKKAQDGAAYAVVEAVKYGCTAKDWQGMIVTQMKYCKAYAKALVEVFASAEASCNTYGKNSFGCAAAIGHADGESQAIISLFSKAVAKAANICPQCDPAWAKAATFNVAKLVVKLTAKASATAAAAVCVGPNQSAHAEAYKRCTAQVYAHGFAYALAEAMIKGKCTNLVADAYTKVKNVIKTDPYCACQGWACVSYNGGRCTSWKHRSGKPINWNLDACKRYAPFVAAYFKGECEAYDYQVY